VTRCYFQDPAPGSMTYAGQAWCRQSSLVG
jgi:hypothetical protein